ncbi:MAG: 2OG-Fe(II) oxygenase [Nitrospirales bacterium]|nr:2OG-Fe(II) oxygenase [Nitrospirales bacterium]
MKYLAYTTYCSGHSGLSNGIMSIEIGTILAHLTNRLLVLEGNESPPANVVQYPGLISNAYPSKVTDLIHLPIPWCESQDIDLTRFDFKEWTSHPLGRSVCSFPPGWEPDREDLRFFAHGRKHRLIYSEAEAEATVLAMSGGPGIGPHEYKMGNFTFYSYFFYLDPPHKQKVFDLLKKMVPKKPYRNFADRVVSDLGLFNAVHIRRGDFKKTFGVTTLDRSPREVLEVLEHHFSPNEKLVILTDDMHDPFFHEIVGAYPDCVFLDQFLLDHYGESFLDLPQHDSIALAFLSQLIAGKSQDFIGSMNSTFSSLIQRFRGNAGREEPFKFLWNELADPGVGLQRGRHAKSRCVPMKHGIMIEQFSGPYSWNRVNPRINPAWMREWPESFIPREGKAREQGDLPQADVSAEAPQDIARTSHKDPGTHPPQKQDLLRIYGNAISKDGQAFVFIGTANENIVRLIEDLQGYGWTSVSANEITLDIHAKQVILSEPGIGHASIPCRALVFPEKTQEPEDQLLRGSSAIAVGKILASCARLPNDRENTVRALCELVQSLPVYQFSSSDGRRARELVDQAHHDRAFANVRVTSMGSEQPPIGPSKPIKISSEVSEVILSHAIQIDDFLSPSETVRLLTFTLDQESSWQASTVSNATSTVSRQDPDYRKSVVLKSFQNSEFANLMVNRVRAHLPDILREWDVPSYSVKEIEAQLTASNDGDFFKIHKDNGSRERKARELTYVYYFYREPKPFIGGELVIYDGKIENNCYIKADSYRVIEPRHNSVVFFPSGCWHEVLPIRCPSQAFADSRFTINGWVQRQTMLPPTGVPDSIKAWAKSLK